MNLFKFYHIALFAFILISAACGESGNEKSLESREKEVEAKEKQLQTFERELQLKENDLIKREQLLDSLSQSASGGVYNKKLVGNWVVTMECIETTCEGSAIGDTKTEQWNISYQNNKVIAKASANKKLIRTYTGLFKENNLALTAGQTPETDTHMDVTLTPHQATEGLMEGQRVISQGGKCKIVYAIKAEKI